jgi:hypothetical protein
VLPPTDPQSGANAALPLPIEIGLFPDGFGSNLEDPDLLAPRAKDIVLAGPDGTFQFAGVVPGPYKVVAVGKLGSRRVTAIQDIHVELGGMPPLTLPLQYGLDLRGKIVLKGPVPQSYQLQLQKVMLPIGDRLPGLSQYFPRFSSAIMASVDADGSFVLTDIVPDAHYDVPMRLLQESLGAYVTIRYGGEPMIRWIATRKDETRLEVDLEFGSGRVEVVVKNGEQRQPEATTVLVPRDRNRRQYYQVRASGSDGKVVFETVAPGDYDVFAWDDLRDRAWFDPSFMKQFSGRGRSVRVQPAGIASETIQVNAAQREVN